MIRVGCGFDVHAFAVGRRLVLGGVEIAHSHGLTGHSDADVLTHAICDALLGTLGLGDIGVHFPDSDNAHKDADSLTLLTQTVNTLREAGGYVVNVDVSVALQYPKLAPYACAMRERLADAMNIKLSQVSVKATTTEKLGFVGREEGIAAFAVALVEVTDD
ncbi:2-C-methyl-D-erythritol 2,4-cyclodiphosphate synthase [Candidatus Persebacteraceae bacterium Df01]|jgi:2-C-methyl-D-erythritol 2,4-cyclodiphosphate synthase|uniref:2-C-methyl-D-erythritol 2,4-cyclodiphosphate synthase n=1 Tax=Candidatus Doriopsillibacter californiensis TaxID=2970740 RepID=A0ABT7QMD8_9GAMM|nr:2-C-methyl-D-erythritol 2,4-cyclodiphosphate synthase [Candidatus Persebacteraceae bacterium Df01]